MELSKDMMRMIILNNYERPNNRVDEDFNTTGYYTYHYKSATCIDNFKLFVKFCDDYVIDAKFTGLGCAISTASINIFCNIIKTKNIDHLIDVIDNYLNMINEKEYDKECLQELVCFSNIANQPNRIPCATIACNSLNLLIEEYVNEQ